MWGALWNVVKTVLEVIRLIMFIYFAWKFYKGEKNENETLWYGVLAVICIV